MRVRVLYFGIVRERVGASTEIFDVPSGATVRDLLARVAERHRDFAHGAGAVRVAVGDEYVDSTTVLFENAEVALIPPVAGG